MLRSMMTAGLILLATGPIDAAASVTVPAPACQSACTITPSDRPSMRDAMNDGVARIAVRATAPSADAAPLTRNDLLNLYLLLSLQNKTQQHTQ